MNLGRGRRRRPDDWPSSHARARADLSDRLDGSIDPGEERWLESHLGGCAECRTVADEYASQRLELRALRDNTPVPPRDLWARTAAAIEAEPRFRDRRAGAGRSARPAAWRNPRLLAPGALLAAALVVVVVVGTLTSSRGFDNHVTPGSQGPFAAASTAGSSRSPLTATPIPVAKSIEYVTRDPDGTYTFSISRIDSVCPATAPHPCDTTAPVEKSSVKIDQQASSVFASQDNRQLIVVNNPSSRDSGTISVLSLDPNDVTVESPSPSATATLASASPSLASAPPSPSASTRAPSPTPTPTATPIATPSASPTPSATLVLSSSPPPSSASPSASIEVTPSPSGGPIEIAHDVALVGESASYSESGAYFAFTARPVDGSAGPDIYVWRVGEPLANPVTSDHRSVFGSWVGDIVVGSTVTQIDEGQGDSATTKLRPQTFVFDPATAATATVPALGQAWRPAVNALNRKAVYWAGSLRMTSEPGFAPDAGRLVLGDWDATLPVPVASGSPAPSGSASTPPSESPSPTRSRQPSELPIPSEFPTASDQAAARHETTIAAGQMNDWDARWDHSGTHLAVWIADPQVPGIGRLSLYAVDPFDGRIDLKSPLLDARLAAPGFAISEGQLVWAEPAAAGGTVPAKVQLLAWTDKGVGTVETITGPAIVVR